MRSLQRIESTKVSLAQLSVLVVCYFEWQHNPMVMDALKFTEQGRMLK